MEIILPHRVTYQIDGRASVADVVEALLGTEQLLRETIPLLEGCAPGLTIEKIAITGERISQDSPLRQALYVALFAVFQKDFEKAVPMIAEKLFGLGIPPEYNPVLTIAFCVVLFFGAETIYNQVSTKAFASRIREHLDGAVKELAEETGVAEPKLRKILETRYGKSRTRVIAQSAMSFFKPSKSQGNAPVLIGEKLIDSETVAEIPTEAQIESADVPEIARPLKDVLIEIHAQDVDRPKQGWAAVVPELSSKRLRMEIHPPLKPEQIYTKQSIRGDVMVISKKGPDGIYKVDSIHLLDVRDAA